MKHRSITSLLKRSCSLILPLFLMVSLSQANAAQYIVKLSSDSYVTATTTDTAGFQRKMSAAIQKNVSIVRAMSGESIVVNIDDTIDNVRALASMPGVEYIEPDLRMYPTLIPNDSRYGEQWSLTASSANPGAIDAETAWDTTTGTDVVIAVIDTGILQNHEEFQGGKLLSGYDFISDPDAARDGDGRDSDPSDEGDWRVAGDCFSPFPEDSSWHGSHVAGTAAATGDNVKGIAGVAFSPQTKILPLRVLGLCGGSFSDIIDAVRWAAGLPVPGAPDNTTPAKVINLSLGGIASCPQSFNDAFLDVYNKDVSVIVAAGNDNMNASDFTPANCDHVMTVAAVGQLGVRAWYSNFGDVVDIAAPGGDKPNDSGILSAVDSSTKAPNGDSEYAFYEGTSMAAPHVAGVAALIYSRDITLSVDEVATILTDSVRPFPVTGDPLVDCTTALCGSGLLDAAAAIGSASGEPIAGFTYSITDLTVDFSDTSTDSDGTVDSWSWDFGDNASSSDQNPSHTYTAAGDYTVALTVTDNDGKTDTTSQLVSVTVPNVDPIAGFTFSINDLKAEFSDTSTDSDGSISLWSWSFGDGASSFKQNPIHTYASEGDYVITLTVSDNRGATNTISKKIAAAVAAAGFTFTTPSNLTVDFSGTSTVSDDTMVKWAWNFGDNASSNDQNPSHTYAAAGDYAVKLEVTDNGGGIYLTSQTVKVTEPPSRSSSGGGGGSFSLIMPPLLFAYLLFGFIRRRWLM